jgi:hypothetical protein
MNFPANPGFSVARAGSVRLRARRAALSRAHGRRRVLVTIPPEPRRAASTRSSTRPRPPESRAGSSAGLSSSRALSPSTPLGRDARERGRKGPPGLPGPLSVRGPAARRLLRPLRPLRVGRHAVPDRRRAAEAPGRARRTPDGRMDGRLERRSGRTSRSYSSRASAGVRSRGCVAPERQPCESARWGSGRTTSRGSTT